MAEEMRVEKLRRYAYSGIDLALKKHSEVHGANSIQRIEEQLVEEACELVVQLMRVRRGRVTRLHGSVLEEIADVQICLEGLKWFAGISGRPGSKQDAHAGTDHEETYLEILSAKVDRAIKRFDDILDGTRQKPPAGCS